MAHRPEPRQQDASCFIEASTRAALAAEMLPHRGGNDRPGPSSTMLIWFDESLTVSDSKPKSSANHLFLGDPYGTRTRVFAVRGRRPRPLDEGAVKAEEGRIWARDAPLSRNAGRPRPRPPRQRSFGLVAAARRSDRGVAPRLGLSPPSAGGGLGGAAATALPFGGLGGVGVGGIGVGRGVVGRGLGRVVGIVAGIGLVAARRGRAGPCRRGW